MYHRFLNRAGIARLVEARFPRTRLGEATLQAWAKDALDGIEEAQEIFHTLSHWTWWEVPRDILFAEKGGLSSPWLVPPEVISYFLPGCMIHSLLPRVNQIGIGTAVDALADDGYHFQALTSRQALAAGWFAYYVALIPEYVYNGLINIVRIKIERMPTDAADLREKCVLLEAFATVDKRWERRWQSMSGRQL